MGRYYCYTLQAKLSIGLIVGPFSGETLCLVLRWSRADKKCVSSLQLSHIVFLGLIIFIFQKLIEWIIVIWQNVIKKLEI